MSAPGITPTGRLVYDGPPGTPDWFEARRQGITGTDLPKILGLSRYGNALSVWRDKRGELDDDEEREAATWGHILEEPVAAEWARRHGSAVSPVGVIANTQAPWVRASLDRLVRSCPDSTEPPAEFGPPVCGLEVKTRSAYKAADYKTDIPDDVLAQTTWGLRATGLDHMHVAVLIGGQRLAGFRVDRDAKLEQYLVEAAEPVWQAVADGTPPAVHPDAEGVLLAQLNDMYRSRDGDRDLPPEARKHLDSYRAGGLMEKDGKQIKTVAKTALVQLLGDGETGLLDDAPVFTYKAPEPGDEITADSLDRLRQECPELYEALKQDGYITPTSPAPRFNLTRRTPR